GFVLDGETGTYTYAPAAGSFDSLAEGQTEEIEVEYKVTDDSGAEATNTITITVTGTNDGPVAVDDSAETVEDTAVTFSILGNDSDVEGDDLAVTVVGEPEHGTVTYNAETGEATYTPNADYNGTDTFTYTITDGDKTDTATVKITVDPVNDAPVVTVDNVVTDIFFADDNAGYHNAFGVYETDANGNPVSGEIILINSDSANSNELLATYEGDSDSLNFFIVANVPNSFAGGEVSFTTGDNGLPVMAIDGTNTAFNVYYSDAELNKDGFDHFDIDSEGNITTIGVEDLDNGGDKDFNDITLYASEREDSATFTEGDEPTSIFTAEPIVTDVDDTHMAEVKVTLTNMVDGEDVVSVDADKLPEGVEFTIDGDTITFIGVDGTEISIADVQDALQAVQYENTSENPDTADRVFSITTNDGELDSNIGQTVVHVQPVNDDPDAIDDAFVTNEDTPLEISAASLLGNDSDVDGDSLSITEVGNAENGTVTLNDDGSITFTPSGDVSGDGSFTYTTSDGNGGFDTATVTVGITPVADAPTVSLEISDDYTSVDNLVINGSFEDVTGELANGNTVNNLNISSGSWIGLTSMTGWTLIGDTTPTMEVHDGGHMAVGATDGENYMDLGETNSGGDTDNENTHIGQVIEGAVDGESYTLSFDYADKAFDAGNAASGAVQVIWGGEVVATIDGNNSDWESFSIELTGGAGNGNNQIEFKEVGTGNDNHGMAIDNVELATTVETVEYTLTFDAAVTDENGIVSDESLNSLTLSGIPEDAVLSVGTDNGDGTWTINVDDLTSYHGEIVMRVPANQTGDVNITATATAVESGNGAVSVDATATVELAEAIVEVNEVPFIDLDGASDEVILTESFENFEVGSGWNVFGDEDTPVTGDNGVVWSLNSAGLEIQGGSTGGSIASDGIKHAELDTNRNSENAEITTTVDTSSGNDYELVFDYKPRPGAEDSSDMKVSFGDAEISIDSDSDGNLTITAPDGVTVTNVENASGWYTFTATFTEVTSSETDLVFEGAGTVNTLGAFLDNITLSSSDDGDTNHDATYVIGEASVSIADTDMTITDADDITMANAVIVIANAVDGDALSFGDMPIGLTASYDISTHTVTIEQDGSAETTNADFQEAIKAVTFSTTSGSTDDRVIEVTVNDGSDNSNTAETTITIEEAASTVDTFSLDSSINLISLTADAENGYSYDLGGRINLDPDNNFDVFVDSEGYYSVGNFNGIDDHGDPIPEHGNDTVEQVENIESNEALGFALNSEVSSITFHIDGDVAGSTFSIYGENGQAIGESSGHHLFMHHMQTKFDVADYMDDDGNFTVDSDSPFAYIVFDGENEYGDRPLFSVKPVSATAGDDSGDNDVYAVLDEGAQIDFASLDGIDAIQLANSDTDTEVTLSVDDVLKIPENDNILEITGGDGDSIVMTDFEHQGDGVFTGTQDGDTAEVHITGDFSYDAGTNIITFGKFTDDGNTTGE
ncbi:MAG: hypothetical protein C0603_04175, partial [Denitrovibrio sp.]